MFHPQRVADWLFKGDTYPMYAEISPSGICNQRCIFCAMDFMGYQKRFLDVYMLSVRFKGMAHNGLKAVMFAGEGEPFLHPRFSEIVKVAFDAGLDIGITTNGTLFKKPEEILPYCKWIKVSCNSGLESSYADIHGVGGGELAKVIANLTRAVSIRKQIGAKCTLGLQTVLLPENDNELQILAAKARDIGMDYLVVKPYSQHQFSGKRVDNTDLINERDRVLSYETDTFKVFWRDNAMAKFEQKREYRECLAMPFWTYIDAGGNVWACSGFLGDERFRYGNINEKSFTEIWDERKKIDFDINECRMACRMDECNRYLWELRHPGPHVNFI